MTRASGDWWTLVVPEAGPGTDYGFLLDGEGPFPDPRSASQPNGVHGLSRLVDHDAFAWNDQAFEASPLPDAVLYELHVGTFTERGTFDAAIERLDHLVGPRSGGARTVARSRPQPSGWIPSWRWGHPRRAPADRGVPGRSWLGLRRR